MSKRTAEDSLPLPLAPSVRPTARVADAAAFAEAARPDTLMHAILPNDVIELIGAKIRSPRLTALGVLQAWMFDTGDAEQRWVEQPVLEPAGMFNSLASTSDGLVALVVPIFYPSSTNRDTVLFAFRESTSRWEAERFCTGLPGVSALTVCNKQLFVRVRSDCNRFGCIVNNDWLAMTSRFPARTENITDNRMSGTRHGICVTGGTSVRTHDYADLYAPAADRWMQLPPMSRKRSYHASVPGDDGNTLFVIGGVPPGAPASIDSVERYDFREPAWRSVSPHPAPIISGHACALGDGRIAVTGGIVPGQYNTTVRIYDACADAWTTESAWQLPAEADSVCAFIVA